MKKISDIVLSIGIGISVIMSTIASVSQNWNAAIYSMLGAIFLMLALILNAILWNIKKEQ